MANDQSVNTPSHWSAAADVGPVDWRGTAERAITDAPAWVLAAVAGGVLIVALVFGFALWSRASKRRAEREQYHRDLVAQAREDGQPLPPEPLQMDYKPLLGGFAVSLHGLWGFATQTADLSFFFAIGFMSMFDILQLRLFSQMFRMADPRKGWTRPMRVMRATAWCFVLLSAVANFQHAPNIWSAPWLAAMPIGAAWVIQVPLKNALDSDDPEEQEKRPEGVKPGPLRLIGLLWRRLWAYFFRKAGLDVTDRADEMVRRARARDAADASYALRGVLTEKQELELAVERATTPGLDGKPMSRGQLQQAQKRLVALNKELKTKVRPRAQSALELADTQDPEQGLQLMQRMAWLTNADDVAMLDYGPESPAMEKLEQLNIAANADFVKSSKRARSAEDAAAEAERRMDAAEQKVTEAQEQLDEVLGRLESAEKEATEEQDRLQKAVEERERLEESDTRADQLYRQVKEELDRTREQLQTLQEERTELSTSSGRVQERLEALVQERDQLAEKAHEAKEELDRTRGQLQTLQEERTELSTSSGRVQGRLEALVQERDQLAEKAHEAKEELDRTRGQLQTLQEEKRALGARLRALEQARGEHAATVPAQPRPTSVSPARGDSAGPRVQADVEGATSQPTRALVADIYRGLNEQQRALRGRPLAQVICEAAADRGEELKVDTVRRTHISADLLAEYLSPERHGSGA